jgi:MFS family permease
MNTSYYRNVPLLALCQAMMVSAMSLVISTAALVGYQLAADKSYATLPVAASLVATMLTSIPAAILMQRIGRRGGFMFASVVALLGAALLVYATVHKQFWLFLFAIMSVGFFNGFGNYYRFTAADVVDEAHKSRAISYVLLGGVVAAFVGPNLANLTRTLIPGAEFAGSYATLFAFYSASLLLQAFLKLPNRTDLLHEHEQGESRSLAIIIRQPKFIVAIISGMLGYGIMSFVMTATPLAMQQHHFPFSNTAFVIQWHILGMFLPSFFTGSLINRIGVKKVMLLGTLIGFGCVTVNLLGTTTTHFFVALLMLGVSWNFLFVGATTMLTETYLPAERFKTQAVNDFTVFTTVALSSLSAGAVQHLFGWKFVNLGVIPLYAIILISLLTLGYKERKSKINPIPAIH